MASSYTANNGAPFFLQTAPASPRWSSWPCDSATWVMPFVAASQAIPDFSKVGFPLRNGSIRMTLLPVSTRKQEWPYQVIFIALCLAIARDVADGAEYKADVIRHNPPWP